MSPHAHQNKTHASSQGSFWKYYFPWPLRWNPFANPFLLVLIISLLVARFENSRIVVEMQSWSLDSFWGALHRLHPKTPQTSKDIFIVSITNSDYRSRELFDSRTPLNPEKIKILLQNVLSLGPKVVGIDLDTKDATVWSKDVLDGDCTVENGVPTKIFPGSNAVMVWARMPVEGGSEDADEHSDRPMQLYQVLGGCAGHNLDYFSGVPRFPLDADGVVRRYVGEFDVDRGLPVESFARLIAEKYCGCLGSDTEEKILNFAEKKNFPTIASSALILKRGDGTENKTEAEKVDLWKQSVRGKVVLIGGEFEDSRDTHDTTPAQVFLPRPMYGIELNAMAIDSDLHGSAITVVPKYIVFLSDILVGTLFVGIFFALIHHPSSRMVRLIEHPPAIWVFRIVGPGMLLFIAATAVTFLIALGLSWTLLLAGSCWMSFIPILIGANIHQYIEHAEMIGKRGKEA